ncbi:MAG: hypothetical protein AAF916_13190, partial [Planctomycetota bacterium]
LKPGGGYHAEAVTAWNEVAAKAKRPLLNRTVAIPTGDIFGIGVPVANYKSLDTAWPVEDRHGWSYDPAELSLGWSAPVSYLIPGNGSQHLDYEGQMRHEFKRCGNAVRSCLTANPNVSVWADNPDQGVENDDQRPVRWLYWLASRIHEIEVGVKVFHWFSTSNSYARTPGEAEYAARGIEALEGVIGALRDNLAPLTDDDVGRYLELARQAVKQ